MKRMSRRARIEAYFQGQIAKARKAVGTYHATPDKDFDKMTGKQFGELLHQYHKGRLEGYEEALSKVVEILIH